MAESRANSPEQFEEVRGRPPVSPTFRGRWCITFVSVVFALGAAVLLFDLFLQVRRLVLLTEGDLFRLSGQFLRGFALSVIAMLVWAYARAIRDYTRLGDTEARRLERAHHGLWKWGAIFLAAHLVHSGAYIAARLPI